MAQYTVTPDRSSNSGFKLFELAGVLFYAQPAFLILVALFAMPVAQAGGSLVAGAIPALVMIVSLILHESGHAFTARSFGLRPVSVTLTMTGGFTQSPATTHPRRLLIVIAGPIITALLAAGGYFWLKYLWAQPETKLIDYLSSIANYMLLLNAYWFVFNVLPVYPMDGGQFLFHLMALRLAPRRAITIVAWISLFVVAALAVYLIVSGISGNLFVLALLFYFGSLNFQIVRGQRVG